MVMSKKKIKVSQYVGGASAVRRRCVRVHNAQTHTDFRSFVLHRFSGTPFSIRISTLLPVWGKMTKEYSSLQISLSILCQAITVSSVSKKICFELSIVGKSRNKNSATRCVIRIEIKGDAGRRS